MLRQGVQGITDIITVSGVINRDFADVKTTMAGMGYAVMGTALRSGPTRAVDAAVAAMASPLLESGAIDGAKGILINITGSSSLKLSEVNEASTIIQNAAHEDANIIFGAVQDEAMADEVKITVIATGFRQGDSGPRRERMLAEPTLPTIHYTVPAAQRMAPPPSPFVPLAAAPATVEVTDVPARPTMVVEPVSVPPIEVVPSGKMVHPAEAEQELAGSGHPEILEQEQPAETPTQSATQRDEAELVPVPRSVFDDDFFRSPRRMSLEPQSPEPESFGMDSRMPSARGFDSPDSARPLRLQYNGVSRDEMQRTVVAEPEQAAEATVRIFSTQPDVPAQADELDIPAFLRRGH